MEACSVRSLSGKGMTSSHCSALKLLKRCQLSLALQRMVSSQAVQCHLDHQTRTLLEPERVQRYIKLNFHSIQLSNAYSMLNFSYTNLNKKVMNTIRKTHGIIRMEDVWLGRVIDDTALCDVPAQFTEVLRRSKEEEEEERRRNAISFTIIKNNHQTNLYIVASMVDTRLAEQSRIKRVPLVQKISYRVCILKTTKKKQQLYP